MPRLDVFKQIKDDVLIENRIHLYRLHFNYLKTCLKHPKEFKVKKSHYSGWQLDKVKSLTFDRWWSSIGGKLFGKKLEHIKQIRTSTITQKDNAIVLQIPTDSPVEHSIQKIREILHTKKTSSKDNTDQRNHHLKLEIYLDAWNLKRGVWNKRKKKYEQLTLLQIRRRLVAKRKLLIKKRLGKSFLDPEKGKTVAMDRDKTQKFLKYTPDDKKKDATEGIRNLERQISRYKLNAKKILDNVCEGEFPGQYSS